MHPLTKMAEGQQAGRYAVSAPAVLGLLALSVVLVLGAVALPAKAQTPRPADTGAEAEAAASDTTFLLEDVVVTAQKRAQPSQDVPVSTTAFDAEQIDTLKLRDLGDLSISLPNVALEDAGVGRGIANFSIRDLGINSSIPSIDPTVGVVIDGIYLGTNAGVLYDAFDLESIEVLRGPQGVLFGRNVIGGAILVNTKLPTNRYEATVRSTVKGGGIYAVETFRLFMAGDYDLTDRLTLTAGLRYTHEEKAAEITNILRNGGTRCHIVDGPDCPSHFKDEASWNNLSPKIGLSYRFDDETLLYAHWARGFRSGGYNLRGSFYDVIRGLSDAQIALLERLGLKAARDLDAEAFDEERIDGFEIGFKKTFGTRGRLNAAFFYNAETPDPPALDPGPLPGV